MSGSLELKGIPASSGYAAGPLVELDRPPVRFVPSGSADGEASSLRSAILMASQRVAALIARSEGEAADILEFQLAMLGDDTLGEPAFAGIAGGMAADAAWRSALDAEIAGYETSDEEYFRARAADLRDIRDQVLRALVGEDDLPIAAGAILFGRDIAPTRFLATDWSAGGGVALAEGSPSSHVAMLARSRGVPMVVGLGGRLTADDGPVLLDAERGAVLLSPTPEELERFRSDRDRFEARAMAASRFLDRSASTADGTAVRVSVNIADPIDVDAIDIAHCDGVGLMRTEFLFAGQGGLPDEETQYRAYRKVLDWASGKPVTIRTVDAGGDKPVAGFTVDEGNPFLGLRGIRLSLARPEVFWVQARALLRAAVHGDLKVMFPMVAVADEYWRAVAIFTEAAQALSTAGITHRMPPLGIMVEVPSVAIAPELLAEAAFFSIGSNDLTQYVMAAARDNTAVASLNDVTHPAVLGLIERVATFGAAHGIPVSLCGDAGGDPAAIPPLLKAGLRDLSVVPAQLAAAKATIAGVSLSDRDTDG